MPLAVVVGATEPHAAAEHVTVHVTLGVLDGSFVTVAVTWEVPPDGTVVGLAEVATEMACKLIVTVAVLLVSETEVAVIVAVAFAAMGDGAV